MHAGGFKHTANLGTYWYYIYNPMYLSGLAAGKVTKKNVIGFVAAHPIPQTLQNINALTYGARSVNPKVKTHVIFTGEWCNPGKGAEAANSLIDLGADVLSQHQDCPRPVVETAAKRGVFSVGYHSADLQQFNPKGWITGADWNWGKLYVQITRDVMEGKASRWVNRHTRGGIESGFVDLAPFGPAVPQDVQKMVMAKRKEILDRKYAVFQGPQGQQGETAPEGRREADLRLHREDELVCGGGGRGGAEIGILRRSVNLNGEGSHAGHCQGGALRLAVRWSDRAGEDSTARDRHAARLLRPGRVCG